MRRAFNSTIRVKEKICVSCGKPCYWFSKKRCQDCAKREDAAKNDTKEQENEFAGLIDDLDALFSQFIKRKFADKDGLVRCFTCDRKEPIGMIQNGHYISRQHLFLRWDERNARPQCDICNCMKSGNLKEYTKRLEAENPGITELLREESRAVYKWSKHELQAMISDYSKRIKLLKQ